MGSNHLKAAFQPSVTVTSEASRGYPPLQEERERFLGYDAPYSSMS